MVREIISNVASVEVPQDIIDDYNTAHKSFSVASLSPDQVEALFSGRAVPEGSKQAQAEILTTEAKTATLNFFKTLLNFRAALGKDKERIVKVSSKAVSGATSLRRALPNSLI